MNSMFNLELLDKNKTYAFYQCGQGFVSDKIVKWSINDYDLNKKDKCFPKLESPIPSHVGFLFFSVFHGSWMILESHAKSKGIHSLKFEDWINQGYFKPEKDELFIWEDEFFVREGIELIGTPYGIMNIFRMRLEELFEKIFNKNLSFSMPLWGLVCSGLYAKLVPSILKVFCLKVYEVAPYHIKLYAIYRNKNIISSKELEKENKW